MPPVLRAALRPRVLARVLGVAFVVLVALALRLSAVEGLAIDYDEDDYLHAGEQYAVGIRTGDLGVFLRENYRTEHPPLAKIAYGIALAPLSPAPEIPDLPTTAAPATSLPEPHLRVARTISAAFGVLAAGALALVSPLAGLALAVSTWDIKYTSQVMLEALPSAFSVLAIVAYLAATRVRPGTRRRRVLLAGAAAFLGLACAGKYYSGLAGIAIAVHWLWESRPSGRWRSPGAIGRWLGPPVGWLALAFALFFAADPYLWPDPVGRLADSLLFHGRYAGSDAVAATGWPFWQPLIWLLGADPWAPGGTYVVAVELLVAILALVGARRLWRQERVVALWFLFAFAFLLAWPTKWPQYVLLLLPPVALAAAHGAEAALLEPLRGWPARLRGWLRRLGEHRGGVIAGRSARAPRRGIRDLGRALPWLAPGALALAILGLVPVLYELAMALTDFSNSSIRDGITGGVVRQAVGGLAGTVPAVPFSLARSSSEVAYVGLDLLGRLQSGVWLGSNSCAALVAFSLIWTVLVVALQAALGLGVALLLARPGVRFVPFWRTLFILPWAIPEFVGAVAWRTIVEPDNGWLALLLGGPVPWSASPNASLVVLLLAGTWIGWPLMMLVATAGLRTIPATTHEAAALDGAGTWAWLRNVTLPLLVPLLAPAIAIRAIAAFNQFYLFYVLGPPAPETTTIATFSFDVFDTTRGGGLFAVSAALNVLTLVALGVLVAWFIGWRERAERVALY